MNLLDLKPQKSSFVIEIGGRKKNLFLRPFSLSDQAWLQENFEQKELAEKLLGGHIDTIGRLVWYMLETKSKKLILEADLTFIDVDEDTGEEIKVSPSVHGRLIELLDGKSINTALQAFADTRGFNAAVVKSVLEDNEKKKSKKQTGAKSST